jgi:hypothetical protein
MGGSGWDPPPPRLHAPRTGLERCGHHLYFSHQPPRHICQICVFALSDVQQTRHGHGHVSALEVEALRLRWFFWMGYPNSLATYACVRCPCLCRAVARLSVSVLRYES